MHTYLLQEIFNAAYVYWIVFNMLEETLKSLNFPEHDLKNLYSSGQKGA